MSIPCWNFSPKDNTRTFRIKIDVEVNSSMVLMEFGRRFRKQYWHKCCLIFSRKITYQSIRASTLIKIRIYEPISTIFTSVYFNSVKFHEVWCSIWTLSQYGAFPLSMFCSDLSSNIAQNFIEVLWIHGSRIVALESLFRSFSYAILLDYW